MNMQTTEKILAYASTKGFKIISIADFNKFVKMFL